MTGDNRLNSQTEGCGFLSLAKDGSKHGQNPEQSSEQ